MLLEGIFLPITTPFRPGGEVFHAKLESNIRRYSMTPAAGMLVLGHEGEGGALTDAETREVLSAAIHAASNDKVMLANVGRQSVAATLELAKAAADAGYDAVTVEAPGFWDQGSLRPEAEVYFYTIADRCPLPVVLVSGAQRPLPVDLIAGLATHANILAILDRQAASRVAELLALTSGIAREVTVTNVFAAVTGRMLRAQSASNIVSAAALGGGNTALLAPATPALKTRTRRVGFQILTGATADMLDAWSAGASGAIPPLGAGAPQACCEVWQAFRDGDPALAAEKQQRLRTPAAFVENERGVAALKYGCDLNGYFGGRPRLPMLPLTASSQVEIEAALAGLKN